MKKHPNISTTPELGTLVSELRGLIKSARRTFVTTVNSLQVLTNFEIGRRIVEYEQKGAERAEYGKELLKELAVRLNEEFGKGFSRTNLQAMRNFFLLWQDRDPRICQKPSGKLIGNAIGQKASDQSAPNVIFQKASEKSPFTLSWSHYVLLLTIKNPEERSFYEIEATKEGWSLPELKRQVASCLYERLALSRDKESVRQLANEGQIIVTAADILKEPYVLEFLGLDEKAGYSESDMESAIIDLKLDKLNHQDLGQMQMYVNYFDRYVKTPDENPTIGILLCKRKKQAIVELTLPADANIHAREYNLYLPSKELLKQKLVEGGREQEVAYGAGNVL